MPCSHEHLQTFGERQNTRKEPFCMPIMQNERNPSGWSGLRACKRDSTRSFHHICLLTQAMAANFRKCRNLFCRYAKTMKSIKR